jgi:hypothetical protein
MLVAPYARFSADLQDARSITDQIDMARQHAAKQGGLITAEFMDATIPGASMANCQRRTCSRSNEALRSANVYREEMSLARPPEAAAAGWAAGAARCTRPPRTTTRLARPSGACHRLGEKAFTLGLLARQLAGPAHGLRLFADALLGRLFVVLPLLHLPEDALALHLLL